MQRAQSTARREQPDQRIGWRHLPGAGVNIILAILAGIFAGLTFPPFEWWPLAWVALVPLFIALRRTSAVRAAGYLALLFGLALCAVSLQWLAVIFKASVLGVFVIIALPWYLFGLAYRTLIGRSPWWAILAMTPILWVAVEWLRCEWWYFRFSWLQLGFTQIPWRDAAISLYPRLGVYGITFLILLVNVALACALTKRDWRPLLAICAVAGGLALWLLQPPATPPDQQRPCDAVIVQDEASALDDLLRLSRMALTPATRLVVWPEYALPLYLQEEAFARRDLQTIQDFARANRCTLIFGTKKRAPDTAPCDWLRRRSMRVTADGLFYNIALVIGPDGALLGEYAKTHPIQFFSDGVPGRVYPAIPTPAGRLGIAICYDFDYAHTTLRLVHHGAEMLVVPTFDEVTWGATQHSQHTRMAQARAAEVGRCTLRATSSGISQILTPDGQPVAAIPDGESAAVSGAYWGQSTRTPYVNVSPICASASARCGRSG